MTSSDPVRPLFDHLSELRSRLLWVLFSVSILSVVGYFSTDACFRWISKQTGPLVFLTPTEGFSVKMKLAVLLGVFFSIPVILFHVWRFVALALTGSEKKVILGVLPAAYVLFSCGVLFGWFVVVPAAFRFLIGFGNQYLSPSLSVDSCLQFALWITAGLGLLFQLPVVIGALAKWSVIEVKELRSHRKHAVLLILVAAALLTPGPDVVSQLMLAIPTYGLFELSILIASYLAPKNSIKGC